MIRRAGLLVLVVAFFVAIPFSGLAQARGGLTILDSSAQVEFPSQLSFILTAKSNVDINDIRLHYTVDQESYAQVTSEVYLEFVPATTVKVRWAWEMRKIGGLPPGASVNYWWTVTDIKGNRVVTTPVGIGFDDNRYSWQSLTEGKITLYWYQGKLSFAQELIQAAQQTLTRLAENTGAYLKKSVKLYVYAGAGDLRRAMIFPQEWTGGVTFPRYGIIAIGIAPNSLAWGKRAMAHELTHLVVHQMTFNAYTGLPTWLDEGLAMYAEGKLETRFTAHLERAVAENRLFSVPSLSSPFSAYAEETYLAYAQSYGLVEFLLTNYGQDKMLGLLTTFSRGISYDEALKEIYGFDMNGLDTLWRKDITKQYQEAGATKAPDIRLLASRSEIGGRVVEEVFHDS